MRSYNLRRALHSVSCELIEGASVNGKPPVSKTGTAGSIPVAPAKSAVCGQRCALTENR